MISTKGRYALRVMIDLAEQDSDGYVALKDIAQRQEISKKYLEIIVKKLVDGKLVESVSGKGGGYRLLRAPEEYPLYEILEHMEDSLAVVSCLQPDAPECPRQAQCRTVALWRDYDRTVREFFGSRTLKDLL